MKIPKIIVTLLIGLIGYSSFGQLKPILYGGVDYYRNTGFLSNAHAINIYNLIYPDGNL